MIFVGYALALAYGMLCLLLSLLVYKLGVDKRLTRKLVHILVGAEWFILYHTVGAGIHFVAVCVVFTLLLYVTHKFNAMPMIASDGDNAPGTVYYGVAMTVMSIVSCFVDGYIYAFGIAVLCTSLGDGLAGVIGGSFRKCNPKILGNKTVFGVFSAFAASGVSALIFSKLYETGVTFIECVFVAILVCGVELICVRGLDNIAIPLASSLFYYALMYFDSVYLYILPILLTPFIICIVLSKNLLTVSGVVFAIVMDITVSFCLGNFGFVLLLSFLVLSVCVDWRTV
jgi:dolichol kinase